MKDKFILFLIVIPTNYLLLYFVHTEFYTRTSVVVFFLLAIILMIKYHRSFLFFLIIQISSIILIHYCFYLREKYWNEDKLFLYDAYIGNPFCSTFYAMIIIFAAYLIGKILSNPHDYFIKAPKIIIILKSTYITFSIMLIYLLTFFPSRSFADNYIPEEPGFFIDSHYLMHLNKYETHGWGTWILREPDIFTWRNGDYEITDSMKFIFATNSFEINYCFDYYFDVRKNSKYDKCFSSLLENSSGEPSIFEKNDVVYFKWDLDSNDYDGYRRSYNTRCVIKRKGLSDGTIFIYEIFAKIYALTSGSI